MPAALFDRRQQRMLQLLRLAAELGSIRRFENGLDIRRGKGLGMVERASSRYGHGRQRQNQWQSHGQSKFVVVRQFRHRSPRMR